MNVSEFITSRLTHLGIDTAFLVTGGGAMYLNDAIGAEKKLKKVYCHHEQAASFSAECYARIANKLALLNVTSGPGGINALNGIFGAFTDSIPMLVVSGQVKRETMLSFTPVAGLRQLGDQEVDIISIVKPITKWAKLLTTAEDIADQLDEAYLSALSGRPGPSWLDVPVDLQGVKLPESYLEKIYRPLANKCEEVPTYLQECQLILKELSLAKRPVILAGSGIQIAGVKNELLELVNSLEVPITTAWMHDVFPNEHRFFAGRPGTIGTRSGNFVVQNADLVIILGSRLNIRQVSYNFGSFARIAKKIWIDIDSAEFNKPYVKADIPIKADLRYLLPELVSYIQTIKWLPKHQNWIKWCQEIHLKYFPKAENYPVSENAINSYHFISELFKHLNGDDIVVCGDATATIVPYQIGVLKDKMRLVSNSGSASMGYDIPAAVGASIANPNARVICLAGDGSSMMNIQELQTISGLKLNIIIFILNNDGYLSIKQTQQNFFGREYGSSSTTGLSFPDFERLGNAFGIDSCSLNKENWKSTLHSVLRKPFPRLCNVDLDLKQEFEPRLKSKMINGLIVTPELEDMYPFLDNKEIEEIRTSALKIS